MKLVREHIDFERGEDVRRALNANNIDYIRQKIETKDHREIDWENDVEMVHESDKVWIFKIDPSTSTGWKSYPEYYVYNIVKDDLSHFFRFDESVEKDGIVILITRYQNSILVVDTKTPKIRFREFRNDIYVPENMDIQEFIEGLLDKKEFFWEYVKIDIDSLSENIKFERKRDVRKSLGVERRSTLWKELTDLEKWLDKNGTMTMLITYESLIEEVCYKYDSNPESWPNEEIERLIKYLDSNKKWSEGKARNKL